MRLTFPFATIGMILLSANFVQAAQYKCIVKNKFDTENVYTDVQIKKSQFSLLIDEMPEATYVSRCSFSPSAKEVTCDKYQVDQIVFDKNVKIKKFYVFDSQFDVQIFSTLTFVENNGRGGIAFGTCNIISP